MHSESAPVFADSATFPSAELAPVTAALSDILSQQQTRLRCAANGDGRVNDPATKHVSPTQASQHFAHKLANELKSSCEHVADIAQASTSFAVDNIHREKFGVGPDPEHFYNTVLAEQAYLAGAGAWIDALVGQEKKRSIRKRLARTCLQILYEYVLTPNFSPTPPAETKDLRQQAYIADNFDLGLSSGTGSGGPSCHFWHSREEARRHVLRNALSLRYGSADLAPAAIAISGAPLVLFVCESSPDPLAFDAAERKGSPEPLPSEEWDSVCTGSCVFRVLRVDGVNTLRSSLSSALKDAVQGERLAPALVVLDADPSMTLCSGSEIARAVCDSYGAALHLEGPALALLLAGPGARSSMAFGGIGFSSLTHSLLLDIGSWFGIRDCGVFSILTDASIGDTTDPTPPQKAEGTRLGRVRADQVPSASVLPMWWLLHRVDLRLAHSFLSGIVESSTRMVDNVCAYPHLLHYRAFGCSGNVLLTCASHSLGEVQQSRANRAVLRYLERDERTSSFSLALATVDNRDWVLFAPLSALRTRFSDVPISREITDFVSMLLVRAMRRCEIVCLGSTSFSVTVKQSTQLELVETKGHPMGPMFFGAVRVVPPDMTFSPGRLQDPDAREQVEKYTCVLAAALNATAGSPVEAVLSDECHDCQRDEEATYVWIGPRVEATERTSQPGRGGDAGQTGESGQKQDHSSDRETFDDLFDVNSTEYLSEPARALAQYAGQTVAELASFVVSDAANQQASHVAQSATDGVLTESLRPVELQPVLETVDHELDTAAGEEEHTDVEARDEDNARIDEPAERTPTVPSHDPARAEALEDKGTAVGDEGQVVVEEGRATVGSDAAPRFEAETEEVPVRETRPKTTSLWARIFGPDPDGDDEDLDEDEDGLVGRSNGADDVDYFRP